MRLNSITSTGIKLGVVSFAFGLVLLGPRPVRAQSDGGALVLHGCPDTASFPGTSDGYAYQVCADIVFSPSGNVDATLHGELLDPTSAPSHAIIVRDFPCSYGDQTTNDSQIVITPDGSVNGYCRIH